MAEIQLTADTFQKEVLEANVPVVVDFYADWCGPCKMMAPVLHQLAEELGDKAKVAKLDVDSSQTIAGKYGISSIPCLILFKGGKDADRLVGYRALKEVKEWVAKFL